MGSLREINAIIKLYYMCLFKLSKSPCDFINKFVAQTNYIDLTVIMSPSLLPHWVRPLIHEL